MVQIFLTQESILFGNPPVYCQIRVIPSNGALTLKRIETVAFILKNHIIAKN